MERAIKNVLYTLNTIEVHGKKDIESMLGCMQTLEKVLNAIAENKQPPTKNAE